MQLQLLVWFNIILTSYSHPNPAPALSLPKHRNNMSSSEQPPSKKRKGEDASNGFNAATDINNASDLAQNTVPILPRDCKTLLLDIEGCTTAISFVHEVLFPFARNNVKKYLEEIDDADCTVIADSLAEDIGTADEKHPSRQELDGKNLEEMSVKEKIVAHVHALMNHDVKATGLKGLQGKVWKAGYASGELKGHIYDDFKPMLDWCKSQGVSVSIYSSGSIGAQKLLFGHSTAGDLCTYFTSHFDTTSGGKKEAESYKTIAKDLGLDPKDICFVSDAEAELVAARDAGIGFPVMSVRAGNKPLTDVGREFATVYSLLQICGSGN
jgi:2,3-diketo-5-methylthio-1-phosphopentane phosphatase